MPAFFHNKIVKVIAISIGALFVLFFVLAIILASLNDARNTGMSDSYSPQMGYAPSAPTFNSSAERGMMMESADLMMDDGSYYYPPQPLPSGYTDQLEMYETTTYALSGRIKEFDDFCGTLANLKGDEHVHFKSFNRATNYCRATIYVVDHETEVILAKLTGFKGIEYTRNTESVTRHKQQLESQTMILQQQLARITSSLTAAEAQLARLNTMFYSSDDVTKISAEVTNSLRYIDQLTQRKISINSQLNNLYQQSADLQARMGVAEFTININRSNPIYVGKYERQWEQAIEALKDTYHETLMGVTAFFGIFLLWIFRIVVYLLVLIVIVRGLWKFVQLLWNKW